MSFVVSFNGQFQKYDWPDITSTKIARTRHTGELKNDVEKEQNHDHYSENKTGVPHSHQVSQAYKNVKEQKDKFKNPDHIHDLISMELITVQKEELISTAKELMIRNDIHHLPVLDKEMVLCGILSDRDIIKANHQQRVHEIMTKKVISAYSDARISDAAKIMLEEKCGSLPIVSHEHILEGIITQTDILKYVINTDQFKTLI